MKYTYAEKEIPKAWASDDVLSALSPLTQKILANRGFVDVEETKVFIRAEFNDVVNGTNLADIDKLTHRLAEAVQNKEHIIVYQDYDVDGCAACAIAVENLRRFGAIVDYYSNDRIVDGFGLCVNGIKNIVREFPDTKVILTVDNGIVAFDGVNEANALGLTVLITDHHSPADTLPAAYAIVNPKQHDETYPFKDFCGAGVILKVMFALAGLLGQDKSEVCKSIDLAAMATVADVVPMAGENRAITREGMKSLNAGTRVFIRCLNESKNIKNVTAHDTVAFLYAPMINAVSRMGYNVRDVVSMLISDDADFCMKSAVWLNDVNQQRKAEKEAEMKIAAAELSTIGEKPNCIVLYNENFKEGIIGILAGNLKEKYKCPAIVFAPAEDGSLKASARSTPGLNIIQTLKQLPQFMLACGGHALAAGFSIRKDAFEEFKEAFEMLVDENMDASLNVESRAIDAVVPAGSITVKAINELKAMEPYGEGFSEPLIGVTANIISTRFMGAEKQHVKYVDESGFAIIKWNGAERAKQMAAAPRKFVGRLAVNEYNGITSPQMVSEI